MMTGEMLRAIITVNVELVQLSLDAFIIRLTVEQPILECSNQVGTHEVEANGKVGGIHFVGLALRPGADGSFPVTRRGGIACCGKEVQILWSQRGEINESGEPRSIMDGCGCEENHTYLGVFWSYQRRNPSEGGDTAPLQRGGWSKVEASLRDSN